MESIKITPIALPNELQFVDEDIRIAFEGTSYIIGTPTNVQLARNLRESVKDKRNQIALSMMSGVIALGYEKSSAVRKAFEFADEFIKQQDA